MIVSRNISLYKLVKWSGHHVIWLLTLSGTIAVLYRFGFLSFTIPWLPVSVIGTAVAFYVGFKNNQAFDRMWEARKIWGAIVNDSRSWGMMVDSFVSAEFSGKNISASEIQQLKKRLIYRHIGWLYTHRIQLLQPTPWEHISQNGHLGKTAVYYQQRFGIGLVEDEVNNTGLKQFIPEAEYERLSNAANAAVQILHIQSQDIAELRRQGLIEDFRHLELTNLLRSFFEHQGKNERIKKFPLPRQYANMSRYFIGIFIALLPFSMIPELLKLGDLGLSLSVPITALIGWVYVMMEIVGDYSENPFQGMANDIPMLSMCRTIEIDLRQMLGETNVPQPIEAHDDILM